MKLLRIQGKNFRSFAEFDLDLNTTGLFSVTGPNGAGKSSIFTAVEWALFGGKRGPGAIPVLRDGAGGGECRVEVEFEIGERVLEVVRIDRRDAWIKDVATGEKLAEGLTQTSNEVAVQIGLSHEMFKGTFYARQTEVQALNPDRPLSERRDRLELLLGIEHLRRAAEIAARAAREQKPLVDALRDEAPDVDELRSDVERCEKQAQEAAPMIGALEAQVVELEAAHKAALAHHDVLVARMSEHGTRSVAAERAEGELKRERVILDALLQRLEGAEAAQTELTELEPVAATVEAVTARERELEMRRRNHEQIEHWRAEERQALEQLASAKDILAGLDESPDGEQSARSLATAQDELAEVGQQLRDATDRCQTAEAKVRDARDVYKRANAAGELDAELLTLADAAAHVEAAREEWQELRGQRAEVEAARDHDGKHRNALLGLGNTDAALCPTCHQPLEGTLGDLVSEYDEQLAAHSSRLADIEARMTGLVAAGNQHKVAAERASSLRARREALGAVGDRQELSDSLAGAERGLDAASTAERELDEMYRRLAAQIPDLRDAVARAAAVAQKRAYAHDSKTQTEQLAATYAKQLGENKDNGYDAAAHLELKSDLERTQGAVRRCAVLRESANSLQMLAGRVATQQPFVKDLTMKVENLRAAASDIEVTDEALQQAIGQRNSLSEDLKQMQAAQKAANDQILMESAAVSAARLRLADGRKVVKRIDQESRELEIRVAVAKGLADYREHASQRARPALEAEASDLLSKMTGGVYSVVRLDESYLLKVADGNELHSVRRFSGGEQDLAALCLRLALSRTLARQRGAEHGFIILDEVCGSQDSRRRDLLLDQLGELARNEFHQIFVISHTDDVIEHCHKHIKVKRENGISTAEGPTA